MGYKINIFIFCVNQVTYHVDGFIDKNNDLLYRDLSRTMHECQHPLLKTLFPEGKIQFCEFEVQHYILSHTKSQWYPSKFSCIKFIQYGSL